MSGWEQKCIQNFDPKFEGKRENRRAESRLDNIKMDLK
jgi:hypothetical protein